MTAPAPKDIPQQFAALAAQYEATVARIGETGQPTPLDIAMLTFVRVQMLDLKIDLLAVRLGAAADPNKPRLIVPNH